MGGEDGAAEGSAAIASVGNMTETQSSTRSAERIFIALLRGVGLLLHCTKIHRSPQGLQLVMMQSTSNAPPSEKTHE